MQCLFGRLVLFIKINTLTQFIRDSLGLFSTVLYFRSAQECVVRHPGPPALGYFSSFPEHCVRGSPAEALPGLDDAVVPALFHRVPLPMPTHLRAESRNPLLLLHTHTAKHAAQQNPGREDRASLIHPPKASARQAIDGTTSHRRGAKPTDWCAPGQLCRHRRSSGNVRCLKIEQMFLLKGLLQCSA